MKVIQVLASIGASAVISQELLAAPVPLAGFKSGEGSIAYTGHVPLARSLTSADHSRDALESALRNRPQRVRLCGKALRNCAVSVPSVSAPIANRYRKPKKIIALILSFGLEYDLHTAI